MRNFDRLIKQALNETLPEKIIAALEEALAVNSAVPSQFERLQIVIRVSKSRAVISTTPEGRAYIAELEKKLG